jgi:SAM-dependent methyltransferase
MLRLNLGCGERFDSDWINLDFVSRHQCVQAHNLLNGIPFPDNQFDVVYHSHVLEHFSKASGDRFISECNRVLKPGGVMRVVVPDLEQIALQYTRQLCEVRYNRSDLNVANYNWAIVELLDQLVREESGGEMAKYWSQPSIINERKVQERVGFEFDRFRSGVIMKTKEGVANDCETRSPSIKQKIKALFWKLLGVDSSNLSIGNFRNQGECHKWMYDDYSLIALLEKHGFKDIEKTTAYKSRINEWDRYAFLDVEGDQIRKPDSLFVEGGKA